MNVGCIGCGFIAGIHAANLRAIDGARLGPVCDLRAEVARTFADRHGASGWSTDPAAVFAHPGVEAVLICTHPTSHAELAIAAAEAGKHVFVEKPLATTAADCVRIIDAATVAGVVLAVDLKFRHAVAVRAAQAAVREPLVLFAQAAMDVLPDDSPHMDPNAGGGILENLGAHLFDLLCAFGGGLPERVFAEGLRLADRDRTRFDAVTGTLRFPSGSVAGFLISDCGEWPRSSRWFLEVSDLGTQALIAEHCRHAVISGAQAAEIVDERDTAPHEVGARAALADFLDACWTGRQPLASGHDGLRSVMMIEAVHRSLEIAAPVHVRAGEG